MGGWPSVFVPDSFFDFFNFFFAIFIASMNEFCPVGLSSKEHVPGLSMPWILAPPAQQPMHLPPRRPRPRPASLPQGKKFPQPGRYIPQQISDLLLPALTKEGPALTKEGPAPIGVPKGLP